MLETITICNKDLYLCIMLMLHNYIHVLICVLTGKTYVLLRKYFRLIRSDQNNADIGRVYLFLLV